MVPRSRHESDCIQTNRTEKYRINPSNIFSNIADNENIFIAEIEEPNKNKEQKTGQLPFEKGYKLNGLQRKRAVGRYKCDFLSSIEGHHTHA